jgi:hypothetical protein
MAQGDQSTASTLFVLALDGFTEMDVHRWRGDCMLRLGDISQDRGDLHNAATLWKAARPLFDRSSQAKSVARIDAKLAAFESL